MGGENSLLCNKQERSFWNWDILSSWDPSYSPLLLLTFGEILIQGASLDDNGLENRPTSL